MSRLAVLKEDPDGGFKKISTTKLHVDYRAKFCFFDLLEHGGNLYFYFHSWYKQYSNALIVSFISKNNEDTCRVLNKLLWDYSLKERNQVSLDPSEIDETIKSPEYISDLKESLVGKNLMITYRKTFVKDEPLFAIEFDICKNPDSIIRPRPGIYIPKVLQPKALSKSLVPKKSISDIITKIKKLNKGGVDQELRQHLGEI